MEQFTASEVRDYLFSIEERSSRQWLIAHDAELGMLRQFADLLEAQEKAVPVAYAAGLEANMRGFLDVMAWSEGEFTIPLYTHPAPSGAEKRETMTPRELAKRIERGEKWKLADESAPCQSRDAERLAEALERTARHRAAADRIDPDQWRSVLYRWEDRALAAHSDRTPWTEGEKAHFKAAAELVAQREAAQAQPTAARVTDAMQELADKYHELLWAVARKFPGETRHETALRYIREAECQEAALAAQENPND